jgi:hypothetical protein
MNSFDYPSNTPLLDESGNLSLPWADVFSRWHNLITDGVNSGTTAQRPKTRLYVGRFYYDETLNKPIWFRALPNVWRDAAGVIV